MSFVILIILVATLVGTLPAWAHSRDWGYGPSGLAALVCVLLLMLLLSGRLQ
ncbi:hypothetical protein AAKU55_001829 [Oxalobacteraceae bacterium GrIS 1.11]